MFTGGRREFFYFLAIIVILTKEGCRGQYEDSETSDYSNEEDDDKISPTYRTRVERLLQGILGIVSGDSSSSGRSSNSDDGGGGISGFIGSFIPKPVKNIIAPVENATAKGFGEVLNLVEDRFHAIFPGTLWCGGGNIANSDEEVGLFEQTDSCCRAHDMCPSNIAAGKSLERLLNNGAFTRSACFCDHDFYSCLKNVSSTISTNIGRTYFNILRPQCFAKLHPIEACEEYGRHRFIDRKCLKYQVDNTQPERLEWIDNPDF